MVGDNGIVGLFVCLFVCCCCCLLLLFLFFFFKQKTAYEIGVTGVQTCALPICFLVWVGVDCLCFVSRVKD